MEKKENKEEIPIKGKILLAEDDKYISSAYKDGFERAGFKIILAYNGEEAINKIRSEKPDLVMLDLIMPVKDGFEVLQELKKDNKLKKIPVFVLSNLGDKNEVEKALNLGAVDYLIKSHFFMKEVIRKAEEHLLRAKVSK